ncbi:MAG: hypothetical protein ACREHD_17000 [Pirellulales bacterium]
MLQEHTGEALKNTIAKIEESCFHVQPAPSKKKSPIVFRPRTKQEDGVEYAHDSIRGVTIPLKNVASSIDNSSDVPVAVLQGVATLVLTVA